MKNTLIYCARILLLTHLLMLTHGAAWAANISWNSVANVGNWSDPANWFPGGLVPDANDEVSIGELPNAENAWVNLDTIQTVFQLEITDGMVLDTNGFPLLVQDETVVDGRNEFPGGVVHPSRLRVDNGIFLEDFRTDRLFLSDGASLRIRDGARVRVDAYLSVGSSPGGPRASIDGTGVIDFYRDTIDPDGPFPARAASLGGNLAVRSGGLTLNQNGSARIDLDGIGNTGSIQIGLIQLAPVVFTINGDALFDEFDGEILVANNNRLNMNLTDSWDLAENGQITLIGTGGTVAVIEGSDLDFRGTLINYDGRIDSNITFHNTAQIEFRGSSILQLEGDTTFAGATFYEFDGASVPLIRQNGDLTVTENTTLNIPSGVFDWDGNEGNTVTTVEAGADFTIQASSIETGLGTTYDATTWLGVGSELAVETPGPWSNAGLIVLDNARIEGSRIVNHSSILGSGLVSPAGIDNRGTLEASGGQLAIGLGQGEAGIVVPIAPIDGADVIDAGVVNYGFDLDGANEDGVLLAINGDMRINAFQGNFVFNGTLNIGFGHQFLMNTGGLHNSGTITLTGGGRYDADLRQAGQLVVSLGGLAGMGDSVIASEDARFSSPGTNELNDNLHLEGNFFVESGATFSGVGSLVNLDASSLTLEMQAIVDVAIENRGLLELGVAGGTAQVEAFENTATSTLAIDLSSNGGTPGFDHDLLKVVGESLLAGTLEVNLLGGFLPTPGDEFLILTAGDGVLGTFDTHDLPPLPAGNAWFVRYEPGEVILLITAVPVPEPSTLLLAAIAALALAKKRP